MKVRVRFAPSPTGYLHVGGARTALFNYLYAKKHGGDFILRIEDTDQSRNSEEAVQVIFDGLRWLGLEWNEGAQAGGEYGPYFQSQRKDIYDKHLKVLEDKGLVYDDQGAIRFRSPRKPVVVNDLVCGSIEFDRSGDPDMTIRRPDGSYIFHFVSVVDDLEMKVTHVIRGEDHLSNTPKHLELYQALGHEPPAFAHIPLILNKDGSKMSKRDEGASIMTYMENGYAPEAVVNYLCLLGWSPKDNREKLDLSEVIELFDLDKINRRNASFDLDKCFWLNGQYILQMGIERFRELSAPFLDKAGVVADSEEQLLKVLALVKEKIKHFSDVPAWISYFFTEEYEYAPEAVEKALKADGALDALDKLRNKYAGLADWTSEALENGLKEIAAETGLKTKVFVHPARVAVSGRAVGPSLYPMLEVMGPERVLARMEKTLQQFSDR